MEADRKSTSSKTEISNLNLMKTYLYGIFDGHNGSRAVDFCMQQLPTNLLFGQLRLDMPDEDIKKVLRQAFIDVEKGYMESLDDLLALRASYDVLDDDYYIMKSPEVLDKIRKIDAELSTGTLAAIALIYHKKLYIANVGNCRALLCISDPNGVLRVGQLSVDHDTKNKDELGRLEQLGVKLEKGMFVCVLFTFHPRPDSYLGMHRNTRLGNYQFKNKYREIDKLMSATLKPIIAEPNITEGIKLDDSHRFLSLMSGEFYKSIEDAVGSYDKTNRYIAQLVDEQFQQQTTITGVAQAVVDEVARMHYDWYMANPYGSIKREDITLIVRNFNYPMPNALKSSTRQCVTFDPNVCNIVISDTHSTLGNNNLTNSGSNTSSSSESPNCVTKENERIEAYVHFNDFYENLEIAQKMGLY